jgi:cell division control protein 6
MEIEEYLQQKETRLEKAGRKIRDYRVFDFNYMPSKPLMRDEVKPIADAMLRYLKTGIPNNLLVVGSRGSGKTLWVRYLAERLASSFENGQNSSQQGAQRREPCFFYINCRHHNTSFKILAEILRVRPRGYGLDELWRQFHGRFRGPLILILDEADLISEKDRQKDLLYMLSRSDRNYMVILLSNNPHFHHVLDSSTRSTLQPEIIHFRNYNANQVLDILRQRVSLGLYRFSREDLARIMALTVQNANSDIRVGIKTLYLCAIEPKTGVEPNFERARRDIVADLVNGLSDKNLIILKAAARTPEGWVKAVYEEYRRLSLTVGESPFSYVYFYSNLSYLQSIGLILLVSTKVRKTYTNRLQLLFDTEVLERVWRGRFL